MCMIQIASFATIINLILIKLRSILFEAPPYVIAMAWTTSQLIFGREGGRERNALFVNLFN